MQNLSEGVTLLKGVEARYPNASDASLRLRHTIIRWRGRFFYVSDVLPEALLVWGMKEPEDKYLLHYNDPNIDVSSIPLGYINAEVPYYLLRSPIRSQRQGVEVSRLRPFCPTRQRTVSVSPVPAFLAAIVDCLQDHQYPTLAEAMTRPQGAAVSKNWAVVDPSSKKGVVFTVYHKDTAVGIYHQKLGFMLAPEKATPNRMKSFELMMSKKGTGHEKVKIL